MALDITSQAAAVGAAVRNVQFQTGAQNLPRKILIIGPQEDPPAVTPNQTYLITSAEEAGSIWGFGTILHRLAIQAFKGARGIPVYVLPQPILVGGAASTGYITILNPASGNGTVNFYVAGLPVRVSVRNGDTVDEIRDALVLEINSNTDLPVTASGTISGQVDMTSKSDGAFWGDHISFDFNLGFQEENPPGVNFGTSAMAGGAGTIPDMLASLEAALGSGDSSNQEFFTDISHCYYDEIQTNADLSEYNGEGNDFVGCYSKTVARPFRSLIGFVVPGSAGLIGGIAYSNLVKDTDRTNGFLCVPGSPNHPAEIGALTIGIMARIANNIPAQTYVGQILPDIYPGQSSTDRWTDDYDNRDLAVKNGLGVTTSQGNTVKLGNIMTFYHPDSVPIASNGYRSQISIAKLQNILYNIKLNFSQEKWTGCYIVDDVTKVLNTNDRQKARDISAIVDDLIALAVSFESHGWIYTAAFTIDKLQSGGYITIRPGTNGFNATLPIILSGEANIIDTLVDFDTSIDVLLAA